MQIVVSMNAGTPRVVIPAKAGIHLLPTGFMLSSRSEIDNMDPRFRGDDDPWSSCIHGNDDLHYLP